MSSCSSSQCDFEAFEPRQSLWKLVEEFLPLEEQREIKDVLGVDIIDETTDLHKEVLMLLEIWQDYRDKSDKKSKELSLNSYYQRLPEPPEVRGNLKKEIQLFVTALKQRSENESMDLLALSKREKSIVEYSFKTTERKGSGGVSPRPATAVSTNNGRSTPRRPSSSASGSRSSSSLSDVMESFQEQLNLQDVDQLADRLRNILHEEKRLLLEDIAFLQNSLFEESHFVDSLEVNCEEEPSLQELKDLGMKLEKEMMVKGTPTPPLVRNSSYSSPPRRPLARPRTIVRSSSSPHTVSSKALNRNDNKPPVSSPPRSESESISPAPPTQAKLKRYVSDPNSPPTSALSPGFEFSSPPAAIKKPGQKSVSSSSLSSSKRIGSESLSPSPPTSAAIRKSGSTSRFRKMVLDTRHGEC